MKAKDVLSQIFRAVRNVWRGIRIRNLEFVYAYGKDSTLDKIFAYRVWVEMSFRQRDLACEALSGLGNDDMVEVLYRWRDYPECPWRTKNHHGSDMVEFLPFDLPGYMVRGGDIRMGAVHGTSRVQRVQRDVARHFAGLVKRWPGREAVLEADDWRDVYRIEADEDMPAETSTAK